MEDRLGLVYSRYSHKFNLEIQKGCLYIVSTPIGNLADISFRAIYILKNVDLIACEDTRVTNFLLKQYDIKNRSISYYSRVETSKTEFLIQNLQERKSIALVSDAGTPCISDPGNILVSKCIAEGIEVNSVPGSSAMIHSLIVSGFSTKQFYFQGFLPLKKGRQSVLQELTGIRMPIIIYESPYRIYKSLKDIYEIFGNKEISVSRELTKKFEQNIRDRIKNIMNYTIKTKGEFVIIINNAQS